jgi:hypothetical protein
MQEFQEAHPIEHTPADEAALEAEQSSEQLEEEQRFNEALKLFREVLRNKDYVIFASTAMRLNGDKYEGEEKLLGRENPGDFDINFFDRTDFFDFIRQMEARGAVLSTEERENPVVTSDYDGAKIVRGTVDVGFGEPYEFEAFLNSTMVPEREDFRHAIAGLNVLTAEGLSTQYNMNREVESRVVDSVRKIKEFLDSDTFTELRNNGSIEVDGKITKLQEVYEALDITKADIDDYLDRKRTAEEIFAGRKTKLRKRNLNLEALQEAQKVGDITTKEEA